MRLRRPGCDFAPLSQEGINIISKQASSLTSAPARIVASPNSHIGMTSLGIQILHGALLFSCAHIGPESPTVCGNTCSSVGAASRIRHASATSRFNCSVAT